MRKSKKLTPTQELLEFLSEFDDPKPLYPTGHEDAIVGVVERFGQPTVLLLDKERILCKLMKDGMNREEAEEFFSFNISGAWVGEGTPAYVTFTKNIIGR